MRSVLREFRDFIFRGNVVDLAVGIIAGAAFTSVIRSLVEDVMTPIIEIVIAGDATTWSAWTDAKTGVDTRTFYNALVAFVLTMTAVFFFIVKPMNAAMRHLGIAPEPEPDAPTRTCPECLSEIPAAATRCAHCTTSVEALA